MGCYEVISGLLWRGSGLLQPGLLLLISEVVGMMFVLYSGGFSTSIYIHLFFGEEG